jgi:hypothetical protein
MGVRAKNNEDADHLESSWKSNRGENVYR